MRVAPCAAMLVALTFSGTLLASALAAAEPDAADPGFHFTSCRTTATDWGATYPAGRDNSLVGFSELADGRLALLTREDGVVITDPRGAPLAAFPVFEKGDFPASSGITALGTADDPTLVIETHRNGYLFLRPDGALLRTQALSGLTVGEPTRFGPRGGALIVSGETLHLFDRAGRLLAREEIPFGLAHDGFATGPGHRIAVAGHGGEVIVYWWRRGRLRPESRTELPGRIDEPPAFGRDGTLYVLTDHAVWESGARKPDRYSALHSIRGAKVRSLYFGSTATAPPLPIPGGEILVTLDGGRDTYMDFVRFSDRGPWRRYIPDGYVMDPPRLTREGLIYYDATFSGTELRAPGGHLLTSHDSPGIVTVGPVELSDGRFAMAEIDGALRFVTFDTHCLPRPGALWPYPEI